MNYKKIIASGLALLLATSIVAPSANAKRAQHAKHAHVKRVVKLKHKRHVKKLTKRQKLYKLANHDVVTPPFSTRQINKAKKLMRSREFRNGIEHYLAHYVSTWDYSKRGVKAHSRQFLANYHSYLYGNYHYRMGYLAGSNVDERTTSENDRISNAKRDKSFWKGFYAGLYNAYGYRASRKWARFEYKSYGKLFDDVAPPYSR